MEELEQSVSDVSSEGSSPSPEPVQQASSEPASQPQVNKEPPFHEHPRFKELINERNQFSQRFQESERRLQELSKRLEDMSKPKPAEDPLLTRLKGIDPEFGKWAESLTSSKATLEQQLQQFSEWRQGMERTNYLNSAKAEADRVQAELKIDPAIHNMLLSQVPMGTPIEQVGARYRAAAESIMKVMESAKREAIASYSKGKTVDAAIPSAPKGSTPKPAAPKPSYSPDKEVARKEIVANAMKALRNQG